MNKAPTPAMSRMSLEDTVPRERRQSQRPGTLDSTHRRAQSRGAWETGNGLERLLRAGSGDDGRGKQLKGMRFLLKWRDHSRIDCNDGCTYPWIHLKPLIAHFHGWTVNMTYISIKSSLKRQCSVCHIFNTWQCQSLSFIYSINWSLWSSY